MTDRPLIGGETPCATRDLMESMVDGERTAREVSDLMEINLGVIERVAARMTEQRLGLPASPPDDMIDYCVPLVFRVMKRRWT